jgi:hypothetical protein
MFVYAIGDAVWISKQMPKDAGWKKASLEERPRVQKRPSCQRCSKEYKKLDNLKRHSAICRFDLEVLREDKKVEDDVPAGPCTEVLATSGNVDQTAVVMMDATVESLSIVMANNTAAVALTPRAVRILASLDSDIRAERQLNFSKPLPHTYGENSTTSEVEATSSRTPKSTPSR